MLEEDRNKLGDKVWFFIDRDFDEISNEDVRTFETDCYSVENYIVHESTLLNLLKVEFHCHAQPEIRAKIKKSFLEVYEEFLKSTEEINFRLFVARRVNIEVKKNTNFSSVIDVALDRVALKVPSDEIVKYCRDPSPEEIDSIKSIFTTLDPKMQYFGKFALEFFKVWLRLLCEDYRSETPKMFASLDRTSKVRESELVLGGLAAKSPVPEKLSLFIQNNISQS